MPRGSQWVSDSFPEKIGNAILQMALATIITFNHIFESESHPCDESINYQIVEKSNFYMAGKFKFPKL